MPVAAPPSRLLGWWASQLRFQQHNNVLDLLEFIEFLLFCLAELPGSV